jgi:hypothetical protein
VRRQREEELRAEVARVRSGEEVSSLSRTLTSLKAVWHRGEMGVTWAGLRGEAGGDRQGGTADGAAAGGDCPAGAAAEGEGRGEGGGGGLLTRVGGD